MEVHLFAVHVEALVHAAEAVEGRARHDHAGTHNPVDLRVGGSGACLNIVSNAAVPPLRRLEASQGGEPFPGDMSGGGELAGHPLLLAVVADDLRAGQNLAVCLGCGEHAGDEGVIQLQVAVEDEHPFAGRGSDAGVHGLTEAAVDGTAHDGHALNLGEGNGRDVVRNDDLDIGGVNPLLRAEGVNDGENRFRLAVKRDNRRDAG